MAIRCVRVVSLLALLVLMLETARTQVPGEPTSASPGSPVAPTCSNYTACKACATQEGCGWCTYSTECMPGNANGSTSGTCVDWSYVWMYEPAQCPLSSPFPSLCTSKPCSDCATTALCGWCDTTCVPGTQNGPYYGACEKGWYYSHCPVVLARNVWWLWSMFALLMVCVIITALGTCFFKRCRALINGTPVSGEHAPPIYQTKLYMSGISEDESPDAEQVPLAQDK